VSESCISRGRAHCVCHLTLLMSLFVLGARDSLRSDRPFLRIKLCLGIDSLLVIHLNPSLGLVADVLNVRVDVFNAILSSVFCTVSLLQLGFRCVYRAVVLVI